MPPSPGARPITASRFRRISPACARASRASLKLPTIVAWAPGGDPKLAGGGFEGEGFEGGGLDAGGRDGGGDDGGVVAKPAPATPPSPRGLPNRALTPP